MRIIEHEPQPAKPTVTSIVVFDPWPFELKVVAVKNGGFFDGCGLHEVHDGWVLCPGDNTLISLSDGSYVVCQESYLQNALKALA